MFIKSWLFFCDTILTLFPVKVHLLILFIYKNIFMIIYDYLWLFMWTHSEQMMSHVSDQQVAGAAWFCRCCWTWKHFNILIFKCFFSFVSSEVFFFLLSQHTSTETLKWLFMSCCLHVQLLMSLHRMEMMCSVCVCPAEVGMKLCQTSAEKSERFQWNQLWSAAEDLSRHQRWKQLFTLLSWLLFHYHGHGSNSRKTLMFKTENFRVWR